MNATSRAMGLGEKNRDLLEQAPKRKNGMDKEYNSQAGESSPPDYSLLRRRMTIDQLAQAFRVMTGTGSAEDQAAVSIELADYLIYAPTFGEFMDANQGLVQLFEGVEA